MTFCFDLDGTLCATRGMDYEGAVPFAHRIAQVNTLFDAGNRIIIDTARGSGTGEDWSLRTRRQLRGWNVKYHELHVGTKTIADIYVDDRAVDAGAFFRDVN